VRQRWLTTSKIITCKTLIKFIWWHPVYLLLVLFKRYINMSRINCKYNKRYFLECQYHISFTLLITIVKCKKKWYTRILNIIYYNHTFTWYIFFLNVFNFVDWIFIVWYQNNALFWIVQCKKFNKLFKINN